MSTASATSTKWDFEIPITDEKARYSLAHLNGIATVVELLKKAKVETAGFTLALAIAERECAEERVSWSQTVFRLASAAGVEIHKVNSIYTRGTATKPVISGTYNDLVEQAEG